MIHNSMTMAWGNKEELLSAASLLEKIDQAIAADYSRKTKKDTEQVKAWMDAETWFSADEAVEHGFVDGKTEKSRTQRNGTLAAYENAPLLFRNQRQRLTTRRATKNCANGGFR